MGIISVEQTDRLYWLGRYSERVYTTLRFFFSGYDSMIDKDPEGHHKFCEKLDIPDIYESKEEFRKKYPFDIEDNNSIISNLLRAYDNAIVLREEIGSESLSYIQLAIYEMQKAAVSEAPLIELQGVIDNMVAFWGIADDSMENEESRNIIKLGKRIERLDLYGRLHMEKKDLLRELKRLDHRMESVNINQNYKIFNDLKEEILKNEINYKKVVDLVERIL